MAIMYWDTNKGPGYRDFVSVQFNLNNNTCKIKIGEDEDENNFQGLKAVYINGVKYVNPVKRKKLKK